MQEVRVPEIGENISSGEVVKVLVSEGDMLSMDQPIAELETDKAVVELPSTVAGRIARILIKAGDTVSIGQVVLQVEGAAATPAKPPLERRTAATPEPPVAKKRPETAVAKAEPAELSREVKFSAAGADVAASPAVRRLARELGVDLAQVIGSGTGGRISPEDVKEFVRGALAGRASQPAHEAPTAASAAVALPDFSKFGPTTREPLSKVRKITGVNMTASWTTIPQVTQHDQADITQIEAFRQHASARVEAEGGKLTMTAVLAKVCAAALSAHPRLNSSLDASRSELVIKQYCHIGIAVDTEAGLIVPVVKDADRKSLTQLAVEIHDLATRTRERKVRPDELEGGTFTISNLGGIGGTAFSPIVFAPQVAILGVARTQPQLRLVSGQVEERTVLPLSLTYDHRVIDGAEGARFLRWIAEALENPYLAVVGA
jgi:pyruvate dehydrogenase E2 component (dihydrolipoamide acetyltransferase)